MLRLMLAHHPQIAFGAESDFIVDAISPDGRFMKREAFAAFLALDRVFLNRRLTIPADMGFAGIANDFLDQVARPKNAPVVGLTIHRHFDRLLWLWPDARFIHLVRDGRDVAMSTIPMGWAGNMWRGIRKWVEVEELWSRMADKLPADRHITIKYENLARDPEYELRRAVDFLGLDFAPEMLRYDAASTYSAPHGDSVGKWRSGDAADISATEHRAARWLLLNGYLLSGSVRAPSIIRRTALRVQDRVAIALHRKSRFGTRLWLASIFAVRFGSKETRERVIREQNEIIERGLK